MNATIAFQFLLAVLISALPFMAGLIIFRGNRQWRWFGATLMAAAVVIIVTWVTAIPTSEVTISFLEPEP